MNVYDKIIKYFKDDSGILAVYLQGSRVYAKKHVDKYSDYDFLVFVDDITKYTGLDGFLSQLEEILIMQKTSDSYNHPYDYFGRDPFTYLIQFCNTERLDITFVDRCDSLKSIDVSDPMIPIIDKANYKFINTNELVNNYNLYQPSQKEFSDTVNEFYWISLYVVKAIKRKELIQAMTFYQNFFLKMLMKMVGFWIGSNYDYEITLGKNYRFLRDYLEKPACDEIEELFFVDKQDAIIKKVFLAFDIFEKYSQQVKIFLDYKKEDYAHIRNFINSKY
jgi:aminoglycoside 6-adenylyltransferase